ncbi:fumarate reductase (CoM/CoB) subunit B [Methanocalculus alkaliphilus]|uniref:fumarate reductase (CoM/CoB) subunit TfrB n=1 Tax=Methanocalculus alkaliphilus TaxID=768730 RepID=UPI00209F360A|nr:fumarate reductase (CoM/CoB) subunit TfrB [Methanocalculus alkaliphilus]MCP1714406.1 fumarate reductase (CoM/CoB) subunit B [Methanocalculus alkaliphilus]
MKEMTFTIQRFDPETESGPHCESYMVRVNDGARVLDALEAVRRDHDPSLAIRSCCRAGQCGSCAVRMNGSPVLACMEEAADGMIIEPLDLPLIRDLVTDIAPVLERLATILPSEVGDGLSREEVELIKPLRECIECLSCVSVCPALKVTDFAGPTAMRQEMRCALDPRDTRDRIPESIERGLFACTTCHRCVEVCPKEIEIPGKAIEKLRERANRAGLTLPRHRAVADLIERTGRSVERSAATFLEQVPEVIEPDGPVKMTIGFFVGCMFNGRVTKPALDAMEVMKRNGIRVVIPHEQVCCGSPLIRTGQTTFVSELKRKNIEAFTSRGIETVMTICAGCGSTLKNDYDTPFTVMDITEILVKAGFEPPAKLPITATYHDPCHLLRGQGIADPPRTILEQVVERYIPMPAQCCGAGGGVRSGQPEEAAALGKLRGEAIEATGADIVVTICPFCEFHIQEQTDTPVKNLASLMLEGYRKKDQKKGGD